MLSGSGVYTSVLGGRLLHYCIVCTIMTYGHMMAQ